MKFWDYFSPSFFGLTPILSAAFCIDSLALSFISPAFSFASFVFSAAFFFTSESFLGCLLTAGYHSQRERENKNDQNHKILLHEAPP
jgi:hypothetical protein